MIRTAQIGSGLALLALTGSMGVARIAPQAAVAATLPAGGFASSFGGSSSDGKRQVRLVVARSVLNGAVQLAVTLTAGAAKPQRTSTYTFTVPSRDLQVTASGATLDTHGDLGSYGHIAAKWVYQGTTSQRSAICGVAAVTPGPRTVATVSATLSLHLPCEGAVSATLTVAAVGIDRIAAPASSTPVGRGLFTVRSLVAKQQGRTAVAVGTYSYRSGDSLVVASLATSYPASSRLIAETHSGIDMVTAASGSLSVSPTGSTLHYRGALGSVDLSARAQGLPGATSAPAGCYDGSGIVDRSMQVRVTTAQAAVTGSASLTICASARATFGAGDIATVTSTGVTAPQPSATPSTSSGPATASGAIRIVRTVPANGASGVSTTGALRITFSSDPLPKGILLFVHPKKSPGSYVLVTTPIYDAATRTATSRPVRPFRPNSTYLVQIYALDARRQSSYDSFTFTTGA